MTIDLAHVAYAGAFRRAAATLVDMVLFASISAALAWPLLQTLPLPPGPVGLEELWRAVSDPSWSSHAAACSGWAR